MRNIITLIARFIIFVVFFGAAIMAADIELVGSIDDGLFAPTSLEVSTDGIAVLEPFSSQIKLYTPEGQMNYQVDLSGDAHSLTKINQYQYIFCDRDKHSVVKVDLSSGSQDDFIASGTGLADPVDLVLHESTIYVLDGEKSQINVFSVSGDKEREFNIGDDNDLPLRFASSFDYLPSVDRFYVLEQTTSQIFVYDSQGGYLFSFASFGNHDGEITRGGEVKVDQFSRVFVTDRFQGRVVSFDAFGNFLANIGGSESIDLMAIPTGLDVDENGLIYVASTVSRRIYVYYSSVFSSSAAMITRQFYPADQATVLVDDLTFIAFAESNNELLTPTGFEYELYVLTETDPELVANAVVVPEETNPQLPDRPGMSATWIPEIELTESHSYRWRVRVVWETNASQWSAWRGFITAALPVEFVLDQNYPNPFNPTTRISFTLPKAAQTRLEIFNLLGARVKILVDEFLEAGTHEDYTWDGTNDGGGNVATGIYFYRLISAEQKQTRKMVLIK